MAKEFRVAFLVLEDDSESKFGLVIKVKSDNISMDSLVQSLGWRFWDLVRFLAKEGASIEVKELRDGEWAKKDSEIS